MAAALLDGCQNLKMEDSSIDTQESSLDTSRSQDQDDDDDELLALRIAALESIKIKEAKAAKDAKASKDNKDTKKTSDDKNSPETKSHPARRGNLVVITCEDESKKTSDPLHTPSLSPPPPSESSILVPVFDRTRPPPGFGPPVPSLLPFPPPRRYSRSPRRWSPSPPPRRSLSPGYRPRRSHSPGRRFRSRSPTHRRPRSPLPGAPRRSRSPLPGAPRRLRSPSPGFTRRPRSPSPRRFRSRSPGPLRRRCSQSPRRRWSPEKRSRSPVAKLEDPKESPESEWETDTDLEEEEKETNKEEQDKEQTKENVEPVTKQSANKQNEKKTDVEEDESVDDFLKLDATAEVDEFSQFLNEFEDEVLVEKKIESDTTGSPVKKKKVRPVTEKKVVEGKKLRKKLKKVDLSTSDPAPPGSPGQRRSRPRSQSPRWRKRDGRSPGGKYFSPARRSSPSTPSRRRLSPERRRKTPVKQGQSQERNSKSKEKPSEKIKETEEERKARDEKDYQERLSKLPTPEREIMEARRKKFGGKAKFLEGKTKISLKTSASASALPVNADKSLDDQTLSTNLPKPKYDTGPNSISIATRKPLPKSPPDSQEAVMEVRKNVVDLRVRLHKKKQETGKNEVKRRSPSEENVSEDSSKELARRKVVPPVKKPISSRLKKKPEEDDSDRSPSPLPRNIRRGSDEPEVKEGMLGNGRRVVVARPRSSSGDMSPEESLVSITTSNSPKKTLKKSLSSRLGPLGIGLEEKAVKQFTEKEIYEEMLRQQEKRRQESDGKEMRKLKRAMKKKEKLERKLKKKQKKSKRILADDSDFSEGDMLASLDRLKAKQEQLAADPSCLDMDSDEELYRFFEAPEEKKERKKISDKKRRLSGDSISDSSGEKRKRRSSGETGLRARVGRKVEKQGLGETVLKNTPLHLDKGDSQDKEDILDKMKEKNKRRLKRMKEIEKDKKLFA